MQSCLIVFYSRTGTTRRLAKALAERMKAETVEIRCARYDGGFLRYLRAGYDSVRGNLPPIEVPHVELSAYDLVLLGAPIWTSHPALPLRSFLASRPELPARIGLFLTYGGHSPPDTAFREAEALLPAPLAAELALKDTEVRGADLCSALDAYAVELLPAVDNKS